MSGMRRVGPAVRPSAGAERCFERLDDLGILERDLRRPARQPPDIAADEVLGEVPHRRSRVEIWPWSCGTARSSMAVPWVPRCTRARGLVPRLSYADAQRGRRRHRRPDRSPHHGLGAPPVAAAEAGPRANDAARRGPRRDQAPALDPAGRARGGLAGRGRSRGAGAQSLTRSEHGRRRAQHPSGS